MSRRLSTMLGLLAATMPPPRDEDDEPRASGTFAPDPAIENLRAIAPDLKIRDLEPPLAVKVDRMQVAAPAMPLERGMRVLGAVFARIGRIQASASLMEEMPGLAALAYGLKLIDGPVPAKVVAARAKRERRALKRQTYDPTAIPRLLGLPVVPPEDLRPCEPPPWADIVPKVEQWGQDFGGRHTLTVSVAYDYPARSKKKPRRERRLARRAA